MMKIPGEEKSSTQRFILFGLSGRRLGLFAIGLLLVVSVNLFLTLPGMDGPLFWSDEAYTATRAINVQNRGLPYVTFGPNLAVVGAHDFNRYNLEAGHGWLTYYLCALSFEIFGVSEWAGRLPFVLFGTLSVILLILVATRLFGPIPGLLAGFLLCIHPVFIKHAIQCRYYTLSIFFSLLFFALYLFRERLSRRMLLLAFPLTVFLLFMSFQLSAMILAPALILADLIAEPAGGRKALLRRWIGPMFLAASLVVPFLVFFSLGREMPYSSTSTDIIVHGPGNFFKAIAISIGFFPLFFLLGWIPRPNDPYSFRLLIFTLCAVAITACVPREVFVGYSQVNDRYILFMLPLGALIFIRGFLILKSQWKKALAFLALLTVGGLITGHEGFPFLQSANDLRFWGRSLVEMQHYYREGLSPDPTRGALDAVREESAGAGSIHVKQFDPVLLIYYLGPERPVRTCCDELGDLPEPSFIVGPPEEFSDEPKVANCETKTLPGIDFFNLNHAEAYRFDRVPEELPTLALMTGICK